MSLSQTCIEQRDQDQKKVKLWIIGGLVTSAIFHGGLLALVFSGLLDRELEIPEEDAIEFIVLEEEIVEEPEPEPEEIVEEPEPEPEPIPEDIVEEPEPEPIPEEIPEEIVEELTPEEPTIEQPDTASLQPLAPAAPQSLPEPEPEPVVEQPPPEPEPIAPPEPEPIAEEPPPEPAPAPDPVTPDPWEAMSEEPVSEPEPEPLPEDLPPYPTTAPEPLASSDIAQNDPLASSFDQLEEDSGAVNTPTEAPDTGEMSPFGAEAERGIPSQTSVSQPGTSGSPTGLTDSFSGIGSGESATGSASPGQGDLAFGSSPLQGDPGGGEPGRPGGTDEGIGNDTGDSTDTAWAGGSGSWACSRNCKPGYPRSLRDLGIEGTATVRVFLEADGRVTQQELVNSSGDPDLDQAALEAASRMEFDPVDGGGSRSVLLPIEFKLN